MIKTTTTDFRANFGKYLVIASREDVCITENGSDVAVLTAPKSKHSWVDDIIGCIPYSEIDAKQIKVERLARKYDGLD